MKNIPEKIYLQVDADGELPDDFNDLAGVTWCAERIHKTDVEYALAGKYQQLPEFNEILYHARVLTDDQFREYWNEVQGNG